MKPPKPAATPATKDEIQQLLDRYHDPGNRLKAENWPQLRLALEAEAKKYGLKIPW